MARTGTDRTSQDPTTGRVRPFSGPAVSAPAPFALHTLSPVEIASGWVAGGPVHSPPTLEHLAPSAAVALEDAVLPSLLRPPCIVEFSGGRDSSVVLATACRVARREGLAPPVPFTRLYGGLPEASEDEWQQLVVDHLGLRDWVRHESTPEVDLLGPLATDSLRRRGMLWPPLAHTRRTELELARGGSLLSGEGGDEVLGPRRLSLLHQMAARRVPWSRRALRNAALTLAPRRVRQPRFAARLEAALGYEWLAPDIRSEVIGQLAADAASEPLDWRRAVRAHPYVKGIKAAMDTLAVLAAEFDVRRSNPLLDDRFLAAVCVEGGRRGFADRTGALCQMFGDRLPRAVLERTTKAHFNRAVFGHESRAFVARWNGDGVDPRLVDADALRVAWTAEEPHALTFTLLQSCWLLHHG